MTMRGKREATGRSRLAGSLAYTFRPDIGAAVWLPSADAEGRTGPGRRPGLKPAVRATNDRELQCLAS
jgi:hypothetical protein